MKKCLKPSVLSLSVFVCMSMQASFAESVDDETLPFVELAPITVIADKDAIAPVMSHDDIYDNNESSTYKNKEEIERFIGESPADIFKGMTGVQSGDARNSGAIDPNVRGVQGQGRVPVTIDGTEQAITVYRGYKGANNRNYIDPLLISDVKVTKGATMASGVQSSVGGAVTINTLKASDILDADQKFAINIKTSIANNSTPANAIDYEKTDTIYAGEHGFDVYPEQDMFSPERSLATDKAQAKKDRDAFLKLTGDLPRRSIGSIASKVADTRPKLLSGDNKAVRIAVAGRGTIADDMDVDGLVAYSHRERGNYYAGRHHDADYRTDKELADLATGDFSAYMADVYRPHVEVPNTSNETESYLLKGTIRPTENQVAQLGVRHTETIYGDIMPSRVADDGKNGLYSLTGRLPQWPLSKVQLDSQYLQYRFNPDNDWLDLRANLWQTTSKLKTNNSGGYPFIPVGVYGIGSKQGFDEYKQGMIARFADKFPEVASCSEQQISDFDFNNLCVQLSWLYGSNTQIKGDSYLTTYNDRVGVSLSNEMSPTDNLDISVSTNWQKENLHSDSVTDKVGTGFIALPRKGRRQAWDVSANLNYHPNDKWNLQAGLTYNNYWALDDFLNEERKNKRYPNISQQITGYNLLYYEKAKQSVQDQLQNYRDGKISANQYRQFVKNEYPNISTSYPQVMARDTHFIENGKQDTAYVQKQYIWQADKQGNFSRANNPFFNGEAERNHWLRPAKIVEVTPNNFKGSGQAVPITRKVIVGDLYKPAKKHRAWAVSPSLVASYNINDKARVYARYAGSARMPSLYESTLGFSLQALDNENQVKPEVGTNYELGYVQDLTPWFKDASYADIKLAYFHNRIDDIIDRTDDFQLKNFDHQLIQGIEIQSRYDDGDWFGDFSLSHNLKHQVCDAEYAIRQDPYYGQVPSCVKYGFQFGYLQNMGQPDWQADLTVGNRLLDDKLTIGTRLHYHSGADKDVNASNYGYSNEGTIIFNTPLDWSEVFTIDGFLNYQINKNLTLELSATNLTDQYYIDPLSRTLMPAPGRAVSAKAEIKF